MKMIAKKVTSFACALCIMLSSYGEMYASAYDFVRTRTLTASDGNAYLVTVEYNKASGIPADAVLDVAELSPDSQAYADYAAASARELGSEESDFTFLRAFDIALTDPQTGERCEPDRNVSVSIRLLDEDVDAATTVSVVHFPHSTAQNASADAEVLNSSVEDGAVRFETDGFSVYVLTGEKYLCTYYFYSYNEYGDYSSYFFHTDQGTTTEHLTIKNGEKLFAPHDPTYPLNPSAKFIGWFENVATESDAFALSDTPFDFSKEQNIGDSGITSVYLYAVFSNTVNVYFHGQYDAETDTYPIVDTYMERVDPNSATIAVDIDAHSAGYYSSDDGALPKYRFYGWSETPIPTAGNGEEFKQSSPYNVSGTAHLYPIYEEIRWLTYESGYTGTGVTYFAPQSFRAADGLPESEIKIPTRQGYTFQGWYLDVEHEGTEAQNGTGLQLTDELGAFVNHTSAELSHYGVNISEGKLYLAGNGIIYAGWEIAESHYKVVVWKERGVGAESYDWAESYTLAAQPGTSLTVVDLLPEAAAVSEGALASYEALEELNNTGYSFDAEKTLTDTTYDRNTSTYTGTKTVAYDDTTVVNLYYKLNTSDDSAPENKTLTFDFLNNEDGEDENHLVLSGGAFVDADTSEPIAVPTVSEEILNAHQGYEFVWYADESCTARVFFDQTSFDRYNDGTKVLYSTMPDHDLTVYGGWEKLWYLIQIDPNHGAMYAYNEAEPPVLEGNGSTYFWKSYQGDYIQEYTWVTRDYVESESGDFYYVDHDYNYVSSHGGDRYTYYTENLEEATEYSTYKYKKGAYLYDGWYQVNSDGTETPYEFGHLITGNTTLRLHWKLSGTYYLEYDADVTVDNMRLIGAVNGGTTLADPNVYRDQARIALTQTAEAPEGYTFVGWRVRGDESGKIVYPGTTFVLPAEYAVTMSGKEKIFLDAVYDRAATAVVVYNANGGSITEGADSGFPYELDGTHPKLNEGMPVKLPHTVNRNVTEGTVTVSGISNNSPILLSSGSGFSPADSMTGAVLSGWNTEPDGSGTHFDLGNPSVLTTEYVAEIYTDTTEPVILYAEWQITAAFDKNDDAAVWNGEAWVGYTPNGERLELTTYVGAKLKEPPEGAVTNASGKSFDFWSTVSGDGADPFEFQSEVLGGGTTLYAHWTDATLVPFRVFDGTETRSDWQRTTKLRVNDDGVGLAMQAETFVDYVAVPAHYTFQYVCLDRDDTKKIAAVKIVDGVVHVTMEDETVVPLGEHAIDLVYLPDQQLNSVDVKIVYVMEDVTGDLTRFGTPVLYNGLTISLNGHTVEQEQTVTVNKTDHQLQIISQTAGSGFRFPTLLDDEAETLSRVYYKLGVGKTSDIATTASLDACDSSDLELYLRIRDNKLQRSCDGTVWYEFEGTQPTVYAIYRERGYELTIKKNVLGEDTGISADTTFGVTIRSMSITRDEYTVEGTGYATVEATPANSEENAEGVIELSVKNGSEIKINGLAGGSYTITETRNHGYNVDAKLNGTPLGDPYEQWVLNQDTQFVLNNDPQPVCRIRDPQTHTFYTLNRALEYVATAMEGTATIELLRDYVLPSWDALEIPSGYVITLTSKIVTSGSSEIYTVSRDEEFTAASMITNSGVLELKNITMDGSAVLAKNSMVQSSGTLTLETGATLKNASSIGNGGAIRVNSGSLTVKDGAALSGNGALSGGAIYVNSGTLTMEGGVIGGETTADKNSATNGGAIYLHDGILTISGGTLGNNSASVNGGAIYALNGTVIISGAAVAESNRATINGGAVYAHSAIVTLENGTVQNNSATSGGAFFIEMGEFDIANGSIAANRAERNGGAVFVGSGNLSVSGGSMTENSAVTNGGAIYADTGTVIQTAGTIGGSEKANSAVNGSGVFINKGVAEFSGTAKVIYNTSTNGGAVGVGSDSARLSFAGGVQIKDNTLSGNPSNVYLNYDSADIISFTPLTTGAYIGVHVPGEYESELFQNRGTVCARFGAYTDNSSSNADFKSYVKSDRLNKQTNPMEVAKDTATNKLYWYRSFTVKVLSLTDNVLPTGQNGTPIKTSIWYNPPASDNRASVIAEDLPLTKSVDVGARVFAGAYIRGSSAFGDYVTRIYFDNETQKWLAVKRDGTTTVDIPTQNGDGSLMLYYASAAYLTVENNTDHKLSINELLVDIQGEKNTVNTGYGYVVAKNGATQDSLEPITGSDLTLNARESIKFLFPGAAGRPYKLNGRFTELDGSALPADTTISYTMSDVTGEITHDGSQDLQLTGHNLLSAGMTYEIIFGGKKVICKIVNATVIDGPVLGTDYVELNQARSDGKVEYCFETLNQAVNFAKTYKQTAKIEMLTDYLIPTADNLSGTKKIAQTGCEFTFTTALKEAAESSVTGMKLYPGTTSKPYATISRDAGNVNPLIEYAVTSGTEGSLVVDKLNFDGKNLGGTNEFGAIKTKNIKVNISNTDFQNFKAMQGGAVSVDYDETFAKDNYGLTVDNCTFVNCESKKDGRVGGGAIWTTAVEFSLTNSDFTKCIAADQGGAVFHRIDSLKISSTAGKKAIYTYAPKTKTYVENCTFINCEGNAAGGLETEAFDVRMIDCTFRNCRAKTRNAGAINIYLYEASSGEHPNIRNAETESGTTEARFIGCTFENCSAKTKGGGIRTQSQKNWVEDCTFTNCYSTGEHGGAIDIMNNSADLLEVRGCTIDGCYTTASGKAGGGIYCSAATLTIGEYDYAANDREAKIPTDQSIGIFATNSEGHTVRRTKIDGCTATSSGGGVAHTRDSSTLTVTNATISGNRSGSTGGGIYTMAKNVEITGSTIEKNTATSDGGGVYVKPKDFKPNDLTRGLVIDGCAVKENVSGGKGGGVYTEIALTLRNNSMITGNRLTTNNVGNAAGVYQPDGLTLTVGSDGKPENYSDGSSVKDNVTATGSPSNLRLWEDKGENKADSVKVLCNLSGKIYVINAKKKGTKFGVALGARYMGFKDSGLTELDHTFIADDESLFGVFDRTDEDGTDGFDIIWRGDVICKLTDVNGRMLYLNEDCTEPAIFDRLDYATDKSPISPFSYLRRGNDETPPLWYYDESNTIQEFNANEHTCCVKLMVSSYDLAKQIKTGEYPNRTVILTTAGRTDSLYPYTGTGNRATINRGSVTTSMINTGLNLTLRNIVLDGAETSVNSDGALIWAKNATTEGECTLTLAESAMLQNGATTKNGGGVYVENFTLNIAGGTIYNCAAKNGGGVRIYSTSGHSVNFSSGLVTRCTATDNGGGISVGNGGTFNMSGSAQITRCQGKNGGGVFIENNRTMDMSGGSVTQNVATEKGGGIYPNGGNTKLYFSGRVNVSGNKLSDDTVNNVYLGVNNTGIINSKGIQRGSYIGVYVPGTYIPLTDEQRRDGVKHNIGDSDPYKSRGGEGDRFGTYQNGTETRFLYFFVNDRNGLKGGLKTDTGIYWTTIFSLEVSKRVTSTDIGDLNEEFEFTVELSGVAEASGMSATLITEASEAWESDNSTVTIENGRATFRLKNGESRRWDNLPAGIQYKVKENLSNERKNHYTTLPGYEIKGTIGENLYKDDVAFKYLSTAAFTNLNAVCKLTLDIDGDGVSDVILHEYDKNDDLVPAVYSSLQDALDKINSGAPFKYLNKYVSSTSWQDFTAGSSGSYLTRIEMLVNSYDLKATHTLNSGKQALLTTAAKNADDGYPYAGTAGEPCVLTRKYTGASLFTATGSLTLTDIVVDGNKANYSANSFGGIVMVSPGGALNVQNGAVLKNSKTTGYAGGAIRVGEKGNNTPGTVTISGDAEIFNNEVNNADANGGAISVKLGTVNVEGGKIYNNQVLNSTKKGYGGAIYLEGKSVLNLSGGVIAGNSVPNQSTCDGAGICLMDTNVKMNISGAPSFKLKNATLDLDGNFKNGVSLINGGVSYENARQDIFINGNTKESLAVTGDITSAEGSIWVWAVNSEQCEQLKPFASIELPSGYSFVPHEEAGGKNLDADHLKAFRNARDDETADNGTESWLYGTIREDTEGYVCWNGVEGKRKVILQKMNSARVSVEGAVFNVYKGSSATVMKDMGGLSSKESGVIWIGLLPFGTYILEETTPTDRWYYLVVDQTGVYGSNSTGYDTREKAEAAAKTAKPT